MGLKRDNVIPWGRCLDEYIGMFSLTSSDLNLAILDCAGGTANFNAEMTRQGQKVISCDPVYQLTAEQIRAHLPEYHDFINGFEASRPNYLWNIFESPEHLAEERWEATEEFLEDFPLGLQQDRYVTAELPDLPFYDDLIRFSFVQPFLIS